MDDDAVAAYVDAMSQAVQLPIPTAFRQGVIDNVGMILAQSAPLAALNLEEADEVATVFRP